MVVAFYREFANFFNEMFSKSNSRKFRPAKYKRHTEEVMQSRARGHSECMGHLLHIHMYSDSGLIAYQPSGSPGGSNKLSYSCAIMQEVTMCMSLH